MTGKYTTSALPCVNINNTIETDHLKVADAIGNRIA